MNSAATNLQLCLGQSQQLVMDGDRLLFPATPGAKTGRSIRWADVENVSEVTESTCPKSQQSYLRLCSQLMEQPLFLKIDLRHPGKTANKFSGFWRFAYLFEQFFMKQRAGRFVIESIHTNDLPHELAVEAILALSENAELRYRYGREDAIYVVSMSAAGEMQFKLD